MPEGDGAGGRTETQRTELPDALQTVLGDISIWNLRHRDVEREREREMLKKGGGLWRGISVVRVCIINNPDQ